MAGALALDWRRDEELSFRGGAGFPILSFRGGEVLRLRLRMTGGGVMLRRRRFSHFVILRRRSRRRIWAGGNLADERQQY